MDCRVVVAVIGHSFIRRIDTCFPNTFKDNYDLKECTVFHKGLGGLVACKPGGMQKSVGHFKDKFHHFLKRHNPSVVVIQLGENDIDSDTEGLVIASTLEEIGTMLLKDYHVSKVFVCELFTRHVTRNISIDSYVQKRLMTNNILQSMLEQHEHIMFWKHKRIFEAQTPIFGSDGVHLGSFGQRRFYRSLRHAIMTGYRQLRA